MYKVEIHLNTILVIALGMISFGIVSAFFYMKRVDVRNYGEQHSRNYISINYLIQLVFLILEVLVVFYHAKYIKDVVAAFGYSTSSIFDIAGKYHVIALFNYNNFIEKAVSASFIYRHGIVWITAYAYVLLYILINNLAVKKKIEIIQIIYLGIYAFDQMLSGGRTALFMAIIALYFSCAYRKIYNNKPFTIIIYAYLFNDLIMLIFSDRFYETVASIGFVKHLLVTFILYKVLIDKGVALEYRHGIKLKFKRQKKTVIPMGTN